MNRFSRIYMPAIICGRGSTIFVTTLGKKRVAVLGYSDAVKEMAEDLFKDTDAEVRYITTIDHEPLVRDIYDNLGSVTDFEPDMILAVGGGSVMDVAKGLLRDAGQEAFVIQYTDSALRGTGSGSDQSAACLRADCNRSGRAVPCGRVDHCQKCESRMRYYAASFHASDRAV